MLFSTKQAIMHALLEYIKKDRFADPLVEKLCLRFDACEDDPRQWRNLAFCLAQVRPARTSRQRPTLQRCLPQLPETQRCRPVYLPADCELIPMQHRGVYLLLGGS